MSALPSALLGKVTALRCSLCGQPQPLHTEHGCPPVCLECKRPLAYARVGAQAGCESCFRELERYLEASGG